MTSLLSLCEGNPPVTGGFPSQRDSNTEIWWVFISLNKLLNKLLSFRWYQTPWHSVTSLELLQRHLLRLASIHIRVNLNGWGNCKQFCFFCLMIPVSKELHCMYFFRLPYVIVHCWMTIKGFPCIWYTIICYTLDEIRSIQARFLSLRACLQPRAWYIRIQAISNHKADQWFSGITWTIFYNIQVHVPIAWWRHQMETFSALLALCEGNHRSPVDSPHKGQWRGALMLSLICVEQMAEQTIETPVIWDTVATIMTSL